jgi:hypothetical protein
MADAAVSKTVEANTSCGFDSHLRHQPSTRGLIIGAWLSLVERSVRVAEVGGSNPLAPTNCPEQSGGRGSDDPTY